MDEQPKPCPFCGGPASVLDANSYPFVRCRNCNAMGPIGEDHVEQWNAVAGLRAERDTLIREVCRLSRELGEAQGRLATSEMAGVVDGWRDRAERAEDAARQLMVAITDLANGYGSKNIAAFEKYYREKWPEFAPGRK